MEKYKFEDFKKEIEKLDSIIKEIEEESECLRKKIDEEEIEQEFNAMKADMSELIDMIRISGIKHIHLETGIGKNYFNWNSLLADGSWGISGFDVSDSGMSGIGNEISNNIPFSSLHKVNYWIPDVLKIIMKEWEWVYINLQRQAFKEIKSKMVDNLKTAIEDYKELERC